MAFVHHAFWFRMQISVFVGNVPVPDCHTTYNKSVACNTLGKLGTKESSVNRDWRELNVQGKASKSAREASSRP